MKEKTDLEKALRTFLKPTRSMRKLVKSLLKFILAKQVQEFLRKNEENNEN